MQHSDSARGKLKSAIDDFPKRAKAIRKACGLKQEDFLPVLRAASVAVLGEGVRRYSQSLLSRLESGKQRPSLADIAVLAACDPEGRDKLWLGWEERSEERAARPAPKVIDVRPTVYREAPKPARKRG